MLKSEHASLATEIGLLTTGTAIAGLGGWGLGKLADNLTPTQFDFSIFHMFTSGNFTQRTFQAFLDFARQDTPAAAIHLLSATCWTAGSTLLLLGTIRIASVFLRDTSQMVGNMTKKH